MDQVQQVKQKTDIVELIGSYIQLTKAGRNFKGLCPFHEEKTPSFIVSPELQMYKCFGCSEAGDVFTFLEKVEKMEFVEALRFLADRAGVELKTKNIYQNSVAVQLKQLNKTAANYYHFILTKHESGTQALKYLQKERKINLKAIGLFNLGFSPPKRDALFNYIKKSGKFDQKLIDQSGIFYKNRYGYSDRFTNRIIFPLLDHREDVVGFAGRILPGDKTKMGKYINSPETAIYKKSQLFYNLNLAKKHIAKNGFALITEGELDAISVYLSGVKNTIASKGTALTEAQMDLIKRFTDKIVLGLDADNAGVQATIRAANVAMDKNLDISVMTMGKFKDPDDFVRNDPQGFKKALEEAVDVWEFIIKTTVDLGNESNQSFSKISKNVLSVLEQITDPVVAQHYSKYAAELLEVDESAVLSQLSPKEKTAATIKLDKQKPDREADRRSQLEQRLITLIFVYDRSILENKLARKLIKGPVARKIIESYISSPANISLTEFKNLLSPELQTKFADMLLADNQEDEKEMAKELEKVLNELRKIDLKQRQTKLTTEVRRVDRARDTEKLKKLLEELNTVNEDLAELSF